MVFSIFSPTIVLMCLVVSIYFPFSILLISDITDFNIQEFLSTVIVE